MQSDLSSSKRFGPFLSLLFLFVLLIALTLFLSQQILSDIAKGASVFDTAFVPMVSLLPLTLLGAVAYQGFRLWRQRRENRPGSRLKLRLSLFFTLAAILASVPQGLLSVGFIDTTMRSWLGTTFGQALENGLNTALEFHQAQVEDLRIAATSPFLPEIVRRVLADPSSVFLSQSLEEYGLRLSALEIYDAHGRLLVRTGVQQAFWNSSAALPQQDGPLAKETRAGSTILRQIRHVSVGDKKYSILLSAILPPQFDEATQNLTGALATYRRLTHYENTFRTLILFFYLMFALPILLIALLIGFTLGDDLIRPLINLESATRRVAEGDFAVRILTPERDELAFLASSFNAMTAELALSRTKIQQTEKITAWQEIARQLAHEIRNPLTPIRLSAERIRRRKETDPSRLVEVVEPAVQAILTEVNRLDLMLREFSDFARLPAPQKQLFTLKPLLESIASVYSGAHPELVVHSEGLKPDIQLCADKAQMEQVFTNLFKNAVEAMNGGGEIFLRTSLVKKGDKPYCRIQIHDIGPGMPDEARDRAFHPYFTTKKDGTGLGLAIVERLVFDHQGSVWFESQPGFGTTFFVELPVEEACETPS